MGIPYSREINAAFEQVTPLVAAGFEVLRTTKNISIILAIIQVLTVLFLGLILAALIALLYTVNPDLEEERRILITPWLKYYAHLTLLGFAKTSITSTIVLGAVGFAAWRLFLFERWVEDVEYDANVDANKVLEDLEEDAAAKRKNKKDGKNGKQKAKSKADKSSEEEEGKK
ncbi:uncharacterized protein M421DRAFT_685 [Didymella exigua CBS 183.55]|uniref:Uncharacterized protein n=1 Tax=Didymella exigua CBS 183.55 TaxID=1150837 RepID=A0A6A5S456_9PLEO|nr:uncharacterized protein M421DRAFT_685 [Didymella exigua CBS 183.55]KAF1933256.1 hypothetical protein M421DRAFT_685 [Didymella exigua CBS 183.55]